MGLSSSTLITDLKANCGLQEDDTEYDNTLCLQLLNQSFWEILDKFKFREKETSYDGTMVISQRDYTIPANCEATRILVGIDDVDTTLGQHTPLIQMSIEQYEAAYASDESLEAQPTHYVRYADYYRFYPTPDDEYSFVLYYWKSLDDLSVLNDPEIPRSWHELVLFGGVWRTFARIGDLPRAGWWKQEQLGLIESSIPVESKEKIDTRLASFDMIQAPYSLK